MANNTSTESSRSQVGRSAVFGSIGLFGLASTGKTAYVIALELTTDDRDRLADWDLEKSSRLGSYVAALGEPIEGTNRRELRHTKVHHRSGYLELYRGYHRALIPLPRLLRHRYTVALPDVAGEAYAFLSGDREADSNDDRALSKRLFAELVASRAMICLIDVKPGVPAGSIAERRRNEVLETAHQVQALDTVLRRVVECRRAKAPLIVSVALTKCDLLDSDEQIVRLRVEDSERWRYFSVRGHLDPLAAGFRQHGEAEVSYSLRDVDAALTPDLRDRNLAQLRVWGDDPAHHDAVAQDWLRCHAPQVSRQIQAMRRRNGIDIQLAMISSWGGPCPVVQHHGLDVEVVPNSAAEISPLRLLAPVRSVLDRVHMHRARKSLGRRLLAAAFLLVVMLLAWPGYVFWHIGQAATAIANGDLAGARSHADTASIHPLLRYSPSAWSQGVAEQYASIAKAHAERERIAGTADTVQHERDATRQAAKRSLELCPDPVFADWLLAYLQGSITRELGRDPGAALAMLMSSEGELPASGIVLARVVLDRCAQHVVRGIERIEKGGPSGSLSEPAIAALENILDGVFDAVDALGAPTFYLNASSSDRVSFASERARALACRARLRMAAMTSLEVTPGRLAKARKEMVYSIVAQAADAVSQAEREGSSDDVQFTREQSREIFARCLRLRDVLPLAERAVADPDGEIERVELLRSLAETGPADSWRTTQLREATAQLLNEMWTLVRDGLQRARTDEPGPFGGLFQVIRHFRQEQVEREVRNAELAFALRSFGRQIRAGRFPRAADAGRAVAEAVRIENIDPEDSIPSEVRAALNDLRGLIENADGVAASRQHDDWHALATLVAGEGTSLHRQLQYDALFNRFANEVFDEAGTPPGSFVEAVAKVLADDELGANGACLVLGHIGNRLATNTETYGTAFAFRRCLEACRDRQLAPADLVAEASGRFRRALLTPRRELAVDSASTERRIGALIESLRVGGPSVDPAPDLLALFAAARVPSAPRYARAILPRVVDFITSEIAIGDRASAYDEPVFVAVADEARQLIDAGDGSGLSDWLQLYGSLCTVSESSSPVRIRLLRISQVAEVIAMLARTGVPDTEVSAIALRDRLRPLLTAITNPDDPAVDALLRGGQVLAQDAASRANAFALYRAVGASGAPASIAVVKRIRDSLAAPLMAPKGAFPEDSMRRLLRHHLTELGRSEADEAERERLLSVALGDGPGFVRDCLPEICAAIRRAGDTSDDRKRASHEAHSERMLRGAVQRLLPQPAQPEDAGQARRPRPWRIMRPDVAAELARVHDVATSIGAPLAAAAVEALRLRNEFLTEVDLTMLPVSDSEGREFWLSQDEVSVGQFGGFLALAPELRIDFECASEQLSYDALGMNDAYKQRVTKDGAVVLNGAVFGVTPEVLNHFLMTRGLRIPSVDEWLRAYRGLKLKDASARTAYAALNGDQLGQLGDITETGVRGMQFGVREWVFDSVHSKFVLLGCSWLYPGGVGTEPSLPEGPHKGVDIGFRVAMSTEPPAVQAFLASTK